LALFDALALQLALLLGRAIGVPLGIGIAVYALIVTIVFLRVICSPGVGSARAGWNVCRLIIYPIGYSVAVSFTNYAMEHLLSKEQVIAQRTSETFAPPMHPNSPFISIEMMLRHLRYWLVTRKARAIFMILLSAA